MTAATAGVGAVLMGRCNPYGHESGGPARLLGGMYGPEYEGRIKWTCANLAEVRVRMVCEAPEHHKGQIMSLCRSHAIEIQRRQASLCTKCAWPPEAVDCQKAIERLQTDLHRAVVASPLGDLLVVSPDVVKVARIQQAIEAKGHRMTELYQSGRIRITPLELTEVS